MKKLYEKNMMIFPEFLLKIIILSLNTNIFPEQIRTPPESVNNNEQKRTLEHSH